MPRFEPKTFTFILNRLANRVVARTELTDLEIGGNVHTILSALARELDDVSFQMVNLQAIWDLDTATGVDLDARALDLNPEKLVRREASKAAATQIFSRSGTSGTVTIPAGTVVKVPGGGPEYETTTAGSILNGFSDSAAIPIIAQEAGLDGNVDPNTITQMNAVTGVETTTNPAAATGGQARETDAEFRTRIKGFLRSLPRGTPDALKFAVLNTFLEDFGRIVSAEVVELDVPNLGQVNIYCDDGTGTIEITDNNTGTPEVVIASAIGGEVRLFTDNKPIKLGAPFTLRINAAVVAEGIDFTLNRATGQITLTTPLVAADAVDVEYTWLEGLIAEAQKIIDGDPADRENYPGYRAAGTQVFVLAPTVFQQIVEAAIIVDVGRIAEADDIRDEVRSAINRYINGLPVNGDVIFSELIFQAQSVDGVADVVFTTPTSNVIIGEGELARVQNSNIDLT